MYTVESHREQDLWDTASTMVNEQLLAYVRDEVRQGTPPETIRNTAVAVGWPNIEVDRAIGIATHEPKSVSSAPIAPVPAITPQQEAAQSVTPPVVAVAGVTTTPVSMKWPLVTAAFVALLLLGGGFAYAYVAGIGPFKVTQYSEDSFLTDLLAKAATINTASYSLAVSLAVNPRDQGAQPFVLPPVDPAVEEAYSRDVRRASDISAIISGLRSKYGSQQTYDYVSRSYVTSPGKPYPATLTVAQMKALGYRSIRGTDPGTGSAYTYTSTSGGKDFDLTVTFETAPAISMIKRSYGYAATTTKIIGKAVTFTKDSTTYLYLPSSLPKPLLAQLTDGLRMLPPDVSGSVSVGATTDFSKEEGADWRFNAAASGDFGDLIYQVDVEAQKKDKNYYFRINKIPSLIPYFSAYKGQWIVITPTSASSTDGTYNEFSSLAESMSSVEEKYKKNRAELAATLKDVATLADQNKLFAFKSSPTKESVDGRSLYRYGLTLRKESVIAFYKELLANSEKYKSLQITQDDGLLEYLQSKEFDDVFAYVDENTSLTLWTDADGYPAQGEYKIRIVPPDTALPLTDKQIDIVFKLTFKDVNKPVQIEVPPGAKSVETVVREIENNTDGPLGTARMKGNDASIKSNLSTLQAQAELYYDSNGSYGTQERKVGSATSCTGGMFKDTYIASALKSIDSTNGEGKNVLCYAYGTGYIAGADLASKGWYCVDSSGSNYEETGSVASAGSLKECP